jgi:hypothetical protein
MWYTFGECDKVWAVVLDSYRPQVAGRQHTQTDGRFSFNNCFSSALQFQKNDFLWDCAAQEFVNCRSPDSTSYARHCKKKSQTDLRIKTNGANTCSRGHIQAERGHVTHGDDDGSAAVAFDAIGFVVFELVANKVTGRVPGRRRGECRVRRRGECRVRQTAAVDTR